MQLDYMTISELCEELCELINEGYANRPVAVAIETDRGFMPVPISKFNLAIVGAEPGDKAGVIESESDEYFQEHKDATVAVLRPDPGGMRKWRYILEHASQAPSLGPTWIPNDGPSQLSTLMPVMNGPLKGAWFYLPMKADKKVKAIPSIDYRTQVFVDMTTRDMWWFIANNFGPQDYTAGDVKGAYAEVSFAKGIKVGG